MGSGESFAALEQQHEHLLKRYLQKRYVNWWADLLCAVVCSVTGKHDANSYALSFSSKNFLYNWALLPNSFLPENSLHLELMWAAFFAVHRASKLVGPASV